MPLQSQTAKSIEQAIKNVKHFGGDIVAGFTGALEDRPILESMPAMKKVWSRLAKIAEDNGVRIAWKNCGMGGAWKLIQFHN